MRNQAVPRYVALLRQQTGVSQLVERLIGDPDDIEMNDRPAVRAGDDVDDAGEERLDGIARHDERPRLNPVWLSGLVEERPDEARVVDLLDVGRQGDGDALVHAHGCLPT